MTIVQTSRSALMIDGLSYDDWEDEADGLRQLATGNGRLSRHHLAKTKKLLSNIEAEIESIDSLSHPLSGFDAIRVACVRDLLEAFRISVSETQRLLVERSTKTRRRQKVVA